MTGWRGPAGAGYGRHPCWPSTPWWPAPGSSPVAETTLGTFLEQSAAVRHDRRLVEEADGTDPDPGRGRRPGRPAGRGARRPRSWPVTAWWWPRPTPTTSSWPAWPCAGPGPSPCRSTRRCAPRRWLTSEPTPGPPSSCGPVVAGRIDAPGASLAERPVGHGDALLHVGHDGQAEGGGAQPRGLRRLAQRRGALARPGSCGTTRPWSASRSPTSWASPPCSGWRRRPARLVPAPLQGRGRPRRHRDPPVLDLRRACRPCTGCWRRRGRPSGT